MLTYDTMGDGLAAMGLGRDDDRARTVRAYRPVDCAPRPRGRQPRYTTRRTRKNEEGRA